MSKKNNGIAPKKKVSSHLTWREECAYQSHLNSGEPALSPTMQAELFELFIAGMSLDEIQRSTKGLRLGAVVRAAEEGDWFGKREAYINGLLSGIRERAQQSQVEAVAFVGLALTTMKQRYGKKMLQYIQSGEEEDLGEIRKWNLHQYKQLVEMLLKLTGQDKDKTVSVVGEVKHTHEDGESRKPLSPDEAMRLLFGLEKARPEEKPDGDA